MNMTIIHPFGAESHFGIVYQKVGKSSPTAASKRRAKKVSITIHFDQFTAAIAFPIEYESAQSERTTDLLLL